jgi:tetratricopeptide (TPR) repeat protein
MQALATGGDRASDYTPLAAEYIRLGRLDEAEVLLQKANLAYVDSGDASLEVIWLKAVVAAERGELQTAVELGEQAVNGYLLQSAWGPGSFGAAAYGQVFFRQSTMAMDLVPQLEPLPLTDRWAARLVLVGDWYAALGEAGKAQAIYQQVFTLVPDNAAAADRLGR